MNATQFTRTDHHDHAAETLSIVRLCPPRYFYSADLGKDTPFLVQITAGTEPGGDFVGLYDLDGDQIQCANLEWELATEVPAEVLEQIETGWESGSSVVERVAR